MYVLVITMLLCSIYKCIRFICVTGYIGYTYLMLVSLYVLLVSPVLHVLYVLLCIIIYFITLAHLSYPPATSRANPM